ncbi:MAG: single-stranded-DNA-specific exonuclease RecJ [Oscillospiraceae bacterium]|nr:single-stranded-DNA-specific exonuclease RecJ [Oscillospiraceae bacterium]
MKYGIWKTAAPGMDAVNALVGAGYAPLAAMVLSARGLQTPQAANGYLDCNATLLDPYLLTDMALAAGRVAVAMERNEKIAVFGDYDVDGITATCLLTDFLRKQGCDCVPYIPGRLEEGYGLNPIAIEYLHSLGVTLIITVDCGITAMEEAQMCKDLGIDLVITDHHECKDTLPDAVAVVDPHRPDGGYPHQTLCGVGVAFKLAAALCGSQEELLDQYGDMVCLGTVADVMTLHGENRTIVSRGLSILQKNPRPGVAALMKQCGCEPADLTASGIGYVLCPRINAAGRMGQIDLAVELFLTTDPVKANELANALCDLNKQRQAVESEIYAGAIEMLPSGQTPNAIVLADESWHQGVVGIVASRIAEEYCCPTFLICLDGEHGKASSRSFGGFNLFSALTQLSHLLESYGGHELAAGFTINRQQIGVFRQEVSRLAGEFYCGDAPQTVLEADCVIPPELLTLPNILSLDALEPCGNGCPKPVLVMENLLVDRLSQVGGGRHMRLRLQSRHHSFNGIFFSATPESASVAQGDRVDVAFVPQINEFRGEKTVQMNIQDIRPACQKEVCCDTIDYRRLVGDTLDPASAARLLPDRATLGTVWRYLSANSAHLQETPVCLCRKIIRWSDCDLTLSQLLTCLDIFADVGLLELDRHHKYLSIRLIPTDTKADLSASRTMQRLLAATESP